MSDGVGVSVCVAAEVAEMVAAAVIDADTPRVSDDVAVLEAVAVELAVAADVVEKDGATPCVSDDVYVNEGVAVAVAVGDTAGLKYSATVFSVLTALYGRMLYE